jgi:hypothetical protein
VFDGHLCMGTTLGHCAYALFGADSVACVLVFVVHLCMGTIEAK